MKICVAVVVVLQLIGGAVAPFPKGHPYAGFNPWIDTWWHKLSKHQQEEVVGKWQKIEPVMLSLAKLSHLNEQNQPLYDMTKEVQGEDGGTLEHELSTKQQVQEDQPQDDMKKEVQGGDGFNESNQLLDDVINKVQGEDEDPWWNKWFLEELETIRSFTPEEKKEVQIALHEVQVTALQGIEAILQTLEKLSDTKEQNQPLDEPTSYRTRELQGEDSDAWLHNLSTEQQEEVRVNMARIGTAMLTLERLWEFNEEYQPLDDITREDQGEDVFISMRKGGTSFGSHFNKKDLHAVKIIVEDNLKKLEKVRQEGTINALKIISQRQKCVLLPASCGA